MPVKNEMSNFPPEEQEEDTERLLANPRELNAVVNGGQNFRPLSETMKNPISDFGTFSSRGENTYHRSLEILDKASEQTSKFLEKGPLDPLGWAVDAGMISRGLSYRQLRAPSFLVYFVLQLFALYAQSIFLSDLELHSFAFERLFERECKTSHNGVCLGTESQWKTVFDEALTVPKPVMGSDDSSMDLTIGRESKAINFVINSGVPTFLMGIEPVAPSSGVKYTVSVNKQGGGYVTWKSNPHLTDGRAMTGQKYGVFVEQKIGNIYQTSNMTQWTAKIQVVDRHYKGDANFKVYIADSVVAHVDLVDKQSKCSFAKSWENFVERKGPPLFNYMSVFSSYVYFTVIAQALGLGLVLYRYLRFAGQSSRLFSRLALLKYVLVDLPQQIAVAAYLYAWYRNDGIKCQLCMMETEYCSPTATIASDTTGYGLSGSTNVNYMSTISQDSSNTALNTPGLGALGSDLDGSQNGYAQWGMNLLRGSVLWGAHYESSLSTHHLNPSTGLPTYHMETDEAMSFNNLILIISLLVSAFSTQMLVAEKGSINTPCISSSCDDDMDCCFISLWRVSIFALSTLPLSISLLLHGHTFFFRGHKKNGATFTLLLMNTIVGFGGGAIMCTQMLSPDDYGDW